MDAKTQNKMRIVLIYFAIKYKGNWNKIYQALDKKEQLSLEEFQTLEKDMKVSQPKEATNIITIVDDYYPEKLKEAYKPPFVFWLRGKKEELEKKFICATGNDIDKITIQRIKKFIPEIIKSHYIVTGSYKGVDQEVSNESYQTIKMIILANGLNNPYLNSKINKKDIVLTEYPPETHVSKDRLRDRNRLIAAFSENLVLFSSTNNGPINNLVTNFLNLGKEIYAFPGDGSEKDGNSELIKQGANLITSIQDISN